MKNIILPNDRQIEWYGRELSAFIHFGMNTFTGREWGDGTESPALFDPTELDCRQWIKTLKDAGFKIAILTAKHHDGFCLWQTKTTEHSIKNSPYKNGKGDIVREFTDACRELGMKAGIYLSPWDRNNPAWGSDAYNDLYAEQLTELMSNYGDIYECWWDGAGSTEAHYDWERWVSVVRKYQPNAVIFGSLGASPFVDVRWVGNEKGIAGDPCFATVKLSSLEKEITSELNSGDPDGECFIPAEADVSIRPGWFYHEDQDTEVRAPHNLVDLWFNSTGRNCGLLLNLPPDRRGLLHENDVSAIKEFYSILTKNFESNLAAGAKVSASSERSPLHPAEAVLDECRESFYSPADGDICPRLVFSFGKEIEINCALFSEVIELGQKVRGFELSALVDGKSKILASGKCIGNKYAARFDTVKTSEVCLKITDAVAVPLIRSFGLYKIAPPKVERIGFVGRDLVKSSSTVTEKFADSGEIFIQLGGIRPFNMLKLVGEGIEKFEVHIFNGSSFEYFGGGKGSSPETVFDFGKIVDWSYRLKIKITPAENFNMEKCTPKLYCAEV